MTRAAYVRGGHRYNCQNCGGEFRASPWHKQKFCNMACRKAFSLKQAMPRLLARTVYVGDCWIAQGTPDKDGYIQFSVGGRCGRAHRFAYEEAFGPVPPGLSILHTCDTPACWRNDGPNSHLYAGTQAQNTHDRDSRGRRAPTYGTYNANAKLTEAQAREIYERRRSGERGRDLAPQFGVSEQTVCQIYTRRTWVRATEGAAAS